MCVDIAANMSKVQPYTLYKVTLELIGAHCSNDICSEEGAPREETHRDI